ncbi:hypothetical protein KPL42_11900 [Clostridium gasigenes]|nr:hypothetical protein [Clostridium gasigenes]MBU3089190.1 hypothetical protein [Clostridium gasigenes]
MDNFKVEESKNMNNFKFEKVETIEVQCDGCEFAAGFGLTFGLAIALT